MSKSTVRQVISVEAAPGDPPPEAYYKAFANWSGAPEFSTVGHTPGEAAGRLVQRLVDETDLVLDRLEIAEH